MLLASPSNEPSRLSKRIVWRSLSLGRVRPSPVAVDAVSGCTTLSIRVATAEDAERKGTALRLTVAIVGKSRP